MGYMAELLSVTEEQVDDFFYDELCECKIPADPESNETRYMASILSYHAFVSCASTNSVTLPTPQTLSQIFDFFVLKGMSKETDFFTHDPELLATAGAQIVFLGGYFRRQLEKRYNMRFFYSLGAGYYCSASMLTKSPVHKQLYDNVSIRMSDWALAFSQLEVRLSESRFLINPGN